MLQRLKLAGRGWRSENFSQRGKRHNAAYNHPTLGSVLQVRCCSETRREESVAVYFVRWWSVALRTGQWACEGKRSMMQAQVEQWSGAAKWSKAARGPALVPQQRQQRDIRLRKANKKQRPQLLRPPVSNVSCRAHDFCVQNGGVPEPPAKHGHT